MRELTEAEQQVVLDAQERLFELRKLSEAERRQPKIQAAIGLAEAVIGSVRTGRLRTAEQMAEDEERQEKMQRMTRAHNYLRAFKSQLPIPRRGWVDQPPPYLHEDNRIRVLGAIDKYLAENNRRNMFLYGGRGTCKTSSAIYYAGQLIKRYGVTAQFWLWNDFVAQSIKFIKQGGIDFMTVPVLILDDVDKRGDRDHSNFAGELLFSVAERLEHPELVTIMTSNHTSIKTSQMFYNGREANQAALASRLEYNCYAVQLVGGDVRQQQAIEARLSPEQLAQAVADGDSQRAARRLAREKLRR